MKTYGILLVVFLAFVASSAEAGDKKGWVIETTDKTNYVGAPVANGRIGLLPWSEPFSVRHVILNHVFDIDADRGVMRVLQGINPFGLEMKVDGRAVTDKNISKWKQSVDMRNAAHNTSFTVAGKAEVSYSVCALRNLPYSGLIRVSVTALDDVSLDMVNTMTVPAGYKNANHAFKSLMAGAERVNILNTNAESAAGLQKVAASSMFIFDKDGFAVRSGDDRSAILHGSLKKGETIEFSLVGAICSTRDFADPFSEAERQVIYAQHQGIGPLVEGHERLWGELWESDIIIEGDDRAQQIVRSALYYLYSFGREGTGLSIPPMGLSSQGYSGHIFWDSELWMFPPMLMMNHGIAESMINYRTDRLAAAERKADNYGYKGAMFPWESDDWGEESTPVYAITGQFEHHIVADIAIAAWNYYCVTKDRGWLATKGYPMIKRCAEFWVSRVSLNADGSYSIVNVVGSDEYAEGVTDNTITNGAAIKALEYASEAAKEVGVTPPAEWRDIASKIAIHKFADGTTMEYLGYDGRMVKQADANLLAYPLGIVTDPAQIRKDLEYYGQRMDNVNGPAMTYSVFCVQYARLGEAEKAYEMFLRCFEPNARPPFGVLSETATSNNPYFATGAGGLLQAVINGFGGLDITADGIVQRKSVLPPSWKKLTITGVGKDKRTYIVAK